jgi:hypothetical protein
MKVRLKEILAAVRSGRAALVGEVAGYLVLGATDGVLEVPREITLESVEVTADGDVIVNGAVEAPARVESQLRETLLGLLGEVRTNFPNLARVAGRPEPNGLRGLQAEIEVALVPVNRRAARRSIGRLVRETVRALESMPPVSASPAVAPAARQAAAQAEVTSPPLRPSAPEITVDVEEVDLFDAAVAMPSGSMDVGPSLTDLLAALAVDLVPESAPTAPELPAPSAEPGLAAAAALGEVNVEAGPRILPKPPRSAVPRIPAVPSSSAVPSTQALGARPSVVKASPERSDERRREPFVAREPGVIEHFREHFFSGLRQGSQALERPLLSGGGERGVVRPSDIQELLTAWQPPAALLPAVYQTLSQIGSGSLSR